MHLNADCSHQKKLSILIIQINSQLFYLILGVENLTLNQSRKVKMKKVIVFILIVAASYAVYAQCSSHKQCCDYQGNCIVVCRFDRCPLEFPLDRF